MSYSSNNKSVIFEFAKYSAIFGDCKKKHRPDVSCFLIGLPAVFPLDFTGGLSTINLPLFFRGMTEKES